MVTPYVPAIHPNNNRPNQQSVRNVHSVNFTGLEAINSFFFFFSTDIGHTLQICLPAMRSKVDILRIIQIEDNYYTLICPFHSHMFKVDEPKLSTKFSLRRGKSQGLMQHLIPDQSHVRCFCNNMLSCFLLLYCCRCRIRSCNG